MKKSSVLILFLMLLFILAGCSGKAEETKSTEQLCPDPFPADLLSHNVYDALQCEWESFDSLTKDQQELSSHLPGTCRQDFDSWAECEEFIGFCIPNPLENISWLEKGTYVGMPAGFLDSPPVQANWYGTREGYIEYINILSGYRSHGIRVSMDVLLFGDPQNKKSSDEEPPVEWECLTDLKNAEGQLPLIFIDSGERYVSCSAYLVQDYAFYHINVIGKAGKNLEVQKTLDDILPYFYHSPIS